MTVGCSVCTISSSVKACGYWMAARVESKLQPQSLPSVCRLRMLLPEVGHASHPIVCSNWCT